MNKTFLSIVECLQIIHFISETANQNDFLTNSQSIIDLESTGRHI